jgi:hypothetical protein
MANLNYVLVECDCTVEQVAVLDETGEDVRLWERHNEIRDENEPCEQCGKLPFVNVAYMDQQLSDKKGDQSEPE